MLVTSSLYDGFRLRPARRIRVHLWHYDGKQMTEINVPWYTAAAFEEVGLAQLAKGISLYGRSVIDVCGL